MQPKTRSIAVILALALSLAVFPPAAVRAADTLPAQLSDAEYWKIITDFSEPDGAFQLEIITSNETSYQSIMPELMRLAKPGGTYFGVGPEQNFTYIAALQPKIAFIFDIRRDMMLEHLMYKSVFEMSANRVDFVSNLFSRKPPVGLTDASSVEAIFQAFSRAPAEAPLAEAHLKEILTRLKTGHGFTLSAADEARFRVIYLTFAREGVLNFSSSFMSPGYSGLMTTTDRAGKNWSFLASPDNYARVRAMHQKNLIVPLVGDFGGPKALRLAGQYLKDHGAVLNVFYLSNVEDYISNVWTQYLNNVASFPMDPSSLLVRWHIGQQNTVASMGEFVSQQRRGR
jgi:hypothetical protein